EPVALGLGVLALRDVLGGDAPADPAVLADHGLAATLDPPDAAVGTHDAVLDRQRLARLTGAFQRCEHALPVLRMHELDQPLLAQWIEARVEPIDVVDLV